MNIQEIKELHNKDGVLFWVGLFWVIIMVATIYALTSTVVSALPAAVQVISGILMIFYYVFGFYLSIFKRKSRLLRVIFLVFYFSVLPVVFSLLIIAGVQSTNVIDTYTVDNYFIGLLLITMVLPYLFLIIVYRQKDKASINSINDMKVAINFITSVFTIAFSLQGYLTLSDKMRAISFIFIIPFSLNLLTNSIIFYIETNEEH